MYVSFKGKNCDLFTTNKQIIRRFRVSNDIVNVQIQGNGTNATISITMKNGKTVLYRANGQIIRS